MVIIWLLYDYYMVIKWLIYGYYMVIKWLLYGYYVSKLLQLLVPALDGQRCTAVHLWLPMALLCRLGPDFGEPGKLLGPAAGGRKIGSVV